MLEWIFVNVEMPSFLTGKTSDQPDSWILAQDLAAFLH